MDRFRLNERVRLRRDYRGVPRGAVGIVIGFYRRQEPTCAVKFDSGVLEVPAERLESAEGSSVEKPPAARDCDCFEP